MQIADDERGRALRLDWQDDSGEKFGWLGLENEEFGWN
jgi:hypothetical protein